MGESPRQELVAHLIADFNACLLFNSEMAFVYNYVYVPSEFASACSCTKLAINETTYHFMLILGYHR